MLQSDKYVSPRWRRL